MDDWLSDRTLNDRTLNYRLSRRQLLQIAGTGAAASVLAACGVGSSTTTSGSKPSGTITFETVTANAQRYQDGIAAFLKSQSSIKVNINSVGGNLEDYKANFPQIATSSDKPDIAWYWVGGGGKFPLMVKAGALEQLDDLYKSEGWDKAFPAATLSAYKSPDGHYYAVPDFGIWHTIVFYNKDIFSKAGVTAPSMPTPWFPSLDDLYSAVGRLRAAGYQPLAVGAKDAWPSAVFQEDIAQRFVPQDVQNDLIGAAAPGGKPQYHFSDPRFVQSEQVWVDFLKHKVLVDGVLGLAYGDAQSMFASGKAAMLADLNPAGGAAGIPKLNPNLNFGWMILPPMSAGINPKILSYNGNAVMVMKGPNAAAAKELLKYLASKQEQERLAASGIQIPARADVDPATIKQGNNSVLFEQWQALNTVGTFAPWADYAPAALATRAYQQSQELLAGSLTPSAAAQQLDQIADQLRAGG